MSWNWSVADMRDSALVRDRIISELAQGEVNAQRPVSRLCERLGLTGGESQVAQALRSLVTGRLVSMNGDAHNAIPATRIRLAVSPDSQEVQAALLRTAKASHRSQSRLQQPSNAGQPTPYRTEDLTRSRMSAREVRAEVLLAELGRQPAGSVSYTYQTELNDWLPDELKLHNQSSISIFLTWMISAGLVQRQGPPKGEKTLTVTEAGRQFAADALQYTAAIRQADEEFVQVNQKN